MTQISVQSPMRVIDSMGASSFRARRRSPRAVLPKVGLSMTSLAYGSSRAASCQPWLPRMQWGTGSALPSRVFR